MRPLLHKVLSTLVSQSATHIRLGLSVNLLADEGQNGQAVFSDGTTGCYDLMVGADGIFPSIRRQTFPQATAPRFTGQVIYRIVAQRPAGFDWTYFYLGADCKVGFNPVSATHMYMFCLLHAPDNARIDPKDLLQKLHEAIDRKSVV